MMLRTRFGLSQMQQGPRVIVLPFLVVQPADEYHQANPEYPGENRSPVSSSVCRCLLRWRRHWLGIVAEWKPNDCGEEDAQDDLAPDMVLDVVHFFWGLWSYSNLTLESHSMVL